MAEQAAEKATIMAERLSFSRKVNLVHKAVKFGLLLASEPRAKYAAKQNFMAHVVKERRARKLERAVLVANMKIRHFSLLLWAAVSVMQAP